MKNYNKSFKVEITANMIAEKFMSNLDPTLTEDRRDKFTDAVIGPMCSNDNTNGLKHLYYALFDLDMDAPVFKEDDELKCTESFYGYVLTKNKDEDDAEARYTRENVAIGPCKLIGFDPYREGNKYEISFTRLSRSGSVEPDTRWVNADTLELASDHVDDVIAE